MCTHTHKNTRARACGAGSIIFPRRPSAASISAFMRAATSGALFVSVSRAFFRSFLIRPSSMSCFGRRRGEGGGQGGVREAAAPWQQPRPALCAARPACRRRRCAPAAARAVRSPCSRARLAALPLHLLDRDRAELGAQALGRLRLLAGVVEAGRGLLLKGHLRVVVDALAPEGVRGGGRWRLAVGRPLRRTTQHGRRRPRPLRLAGGRSQVRKRCARAARTFCAAAPTRCPPP